MKNLTMIALALLCFASCTKQERVKHFGGEMTISVPKGQKLIIATWKESDLWILTEPMDKDYIPKTKIFKESSAWGVMQGSITFKESR